VVIGYDSGQQADGPSARAPEAGAITQNRSASATSASKPRQGRQGESLPKTIDTGFMWYDAKNIDSPEIQAYYISKR